jgi:hypothetical protein
MTKVYRISSSADRKKIVADRIIKYLMKHPEGKDTLEGIAEWWLEINYIEESVELVANALSHLCQQENILSEKGFNGSIYYKLNSKQQLAQN